MNARCALAGLACALATAALPATALPASDPVPDHDAYVWQRVWTPAVTHAIRQNADLVRGWRVLLAEADRNGSLRPVRILPAPLQDGGRPVTLVIRIDGQLPARDTGRLVAQVTEQLNRARSLPLAVSGLEIDHDCGVGSLAGYEDFLRQVRLTLPSTVTLSITAVPAWLDSPRLSSLLAAVDESVLQVHAVSRPEHGLFDPGQAARWVRAYATRSGRPFRVALPTYGSRVTFGAEGRVVAIDSESGSGTGPAGRELAVDPADVRRLMDDLGAAPPRNFAGYAWFRLPTDSDARAWRTATWRAVIQGRPLAAPPRLLREAGDEPGLEDLSLRNDGPTDAVLPLRVAVNGTCSDADAIGGYAVERRDGRYWFVRPGTSLLRPGGQLAIGWVRCGGGK